MRAGAVQLHSTDDVEQNLATADRLVRRAAALGAELVCLPEKWTVLGQAKHLRAGAQTLDGEAITWARSVAGELGIDLIAGSIVEAIAGREKLGNTSVHVGPDGEVRATYRKLHLFDVDVDGTTYAESDTDEAGSEIVVSQLSDGTTLGLTICYDLRFPELFRVLAARGAQIVTLPSAFTLATTRDHWEVLVRARAIENQCFMIAPNQIGAHPGGFRSGGRSLVVDPWGVVLAGAPDTETVVVADLDLDRVAAVRAQIPVLSHRRADVYGSGTP